MKKFEQYTKWVIIFVVGTALITVYKTFDNLQNIFSFLGKLFSALTPFIIGFVIAYILNLPCKKLEKLYSSANPDLIKKNASKLSIVSVYVIFAIIVFVIIRAIIPKLYTNITDLYNNIIPFTQNALSEIDVFQKKFGITIIDINEDTAKSTLQNILNNVNIGGFGKYAKGAISFTSGLFNIFIAIIVSIYMLVDRERLVSGYNHFISIVIPQSKLKTFKRYTARINEICSNYVYSCVMDAAIVAVLSTIILSIIGIKYSIIFGTFIGCCNLIPYFGAIISNCITMVFVFFSSGWVKTLWTMASLFILGQLDGNVIGPKIMGSKLEVRPILIIFSITLGGGLFGVPGMLLSVPAMMVIKMLLSELMLNIEEKREAEKNKE